MSEAPLLVPENVFEAWRNALQAREPRALELAYGLALALPELDETGELKAAARATGDPNSFEIADEVLTVLDEAAAKYEAFHGGDFQQIDIGNPNVLAFERTTTDERVLIVNNLTLASQPVKFRGYAGKEGWDILNRVEFTFPARAQLEPYEFLWLLVD
jgi:hypothetical protein